MVVAGCATVDPKVIQTRLSGKSILVASTVESSLNLLWIGTTVFNNESGRLAVPDWSLDTLVVGAAIAELIETKRYRSVAIAEKIDPTKDGFVNAQKGKADFLVLLEPGFSEDRIFSTNQTIRGIGVLQRSVLGSQPRTVVHAALKGKIFDLGTGDSLGEKSTLQFTWIFSPLESGPKLSSKGVQETRGAAASRTEFAVSTLLDALGLR
jgi:hypothetical protein